MSPVTLIFGTSPLMDMSSRFNVKASLQRRPKFPVKLRMTAIRAPQLAPTNLIQSSHTGLVKAGACPSFCLVFFPLVIANRDHLFNPSLRGQMHLEPRSLQIQHGDLHACTIFRHIFHPNWTVLPLKHVMEGPLKFETSAGPGNALPFAPPPSPGLRRHREEGLVVLGQTYLIWLHLNSVSLCFHA